MIFVRRQFVLILQLSPANQAEPARLHLIPLIGGLEISIKLDLGRFSELHQLQILNPIIDEHPYRLRHLVG